MGGLVMDVRDLHDEYSRVTITPEGVLHLASEGHFIEVSDETIERQEQV
jgi:alanine dehydrogenase